MEGVDARCMFELTHTSHWVSQEVRFPNLDLVTVLSNLSLVH